MLIGLAPVHSVSALQKEKTYVCGYTKYSYSVNILIAIFFRPFRNNLLIHYFQNKSPVAVNNDHGAIL